MDNIPVILVDNLPTLENTSQYLEQTIYDFGCTLVTCLHMMATVLLDSILVIFLILEKTAAMLVILESILVMSVNIFV
jgi:hypothetical protein